MNDFLKLSGKSYIQGKAADFVCGRTRALYPITQLVEYSSKYLATMLQLFGSDVWKKLPLKWRTECFA